MRNLPRAEAVYKLAPRLGASEKERGNEMILKLLIDFYRWAWGMKPWITETVDEPTALLIVFGAMIDIVAIVGIVGLAVTAYNDRKRGK